MDHGESFNINFRDRTGIFDMKVCRRVVAIVNLSGIGKLLFETWENLFRSFSSQTHVDRIGA